MLDKFPKIAFYDREGNFFPLFGHANGVKVWDDVGS